MDRIDTTSSAPTASQPANTASETRQGIRSGVGKGGSISGNKAGGLEVSGGSGTGASISFEDYRKLSGTDFIHRSRKPGKKKGTAPPRPYQRKVPIPRASSPKHRPQSKRNVIVARWSGVNLTTEYPIYQPDLDNDLSVWETIEDSPEATPDQTNPSEKSPSHKALSFSSPQRQNVWRFAGPVDGMALAPLPIPATTQNAMLVHTFSKLLYHFKGSFDGDPDADNPFITDYVPWCIQSPLLAQTSLYISARSLTENQHVDRTYAMRLKGTAIHTLNTHLQSANWASDEALAGVVQFVSIEWFFGEPEVVLAHLRGLREMVRLRGGFTPVGVGGLVTKVALVDDAVIAMSLESNPILQQGPGFDFGHREHPRAQFKHGFSSPFLPGSFVFSSRARELGIHPATAAILDDVQFLVNTVLELGERPSNQDLTKLGSTATWIYDRISRLPKDLAEVSTKTAAQSREIKTTEPLVEHIEEDSDSSASFSIKPHSLLPQYPEFTSSPAPSSTTGLNDDSPTGTYPSTTTATPTSSLRNFPSTSKSQSSPEETSRVSSSTECDLKDPATPTACSSDSTSPAPESQPGKPESDPLYTAVRLAAPLYAGAISTRQPFSKICEPADALHILAATWRIPLSRWRGVIGPLLFTLISIIATVANAASAATAAAASPAGDGVEDEEAKEAAGTNRALVPHAGFVKSILQIGFMQIALEDWEVCRETMARCLRLLEWLRGPIVNSKGPVGAADKGKTGG
ncbi:hypothetical protein QBC37DRAFT_473101 [Rhypophila decipiens]|uniref:Tachykinin family protein n=1 Tax=Rhypophila decipiens TaxID=261697 RepID=A0AAN7BA71_9PEZI|nr:hypothetical protein QBC37DRAFT_473101 [Rhypophila decipiens]